MKIRDLLKRLEVLAPSAYAEDWDNCGLLTGDPDWKLNGITLTLDVTPAAVRACVRRKCNMMISHHPLIFKSLKTLREDCGSGSLLAELIRRRIAVAALHTNFDSSPRGHNVWIAQKLGLEEITPLQPCSDIWKLVTFVPEGWEDRVRKALSRAGAGCIGKYTECTFTVNGEGTFRGGEGTCPAIGRSGELEKVCEVRMEMVCEGWMRSAVARALCEVHPYEEPAYEFIRIHAPEKNVGLGRMGTLKRPVTLNTIAGKIKKILSIPRLRIGGAVPDSVCRIAVCTGAGEDLIRRAVSEGCDLMITGDISYHNWDAPGLCLIDAGHYGTEKVFPAVMKELLTPDMEKGIPVSCFEISPPFTEK